MEISQKKSPLLQLLATATEQLSGESLSKELGISRVAVWKQIQTLKNAGHEVLSTAKGYSLIRADDIPYPWELKNWEELVYYFPVSESTMTIAKKLAKSGCPHFTTVIAGQQSRGRGRLERRWESANGGLYMTIIIRPDLPPHLIHKITFTAAVTLVQLLREEFGIQATIKWPNDILVGESKIAGLLSEMSMEADQIKYLNIGIGLNVHNMISRELSTATSMTEHCSKLIDRRAFTRSFLSAFQQNIELLSLSQVIDSWQQNSSTPGRMVSIETRDQVIEGKAIEIDTSGSLIVRLPDQTLVTVYHGDCFHR